MDGVEEQQPPPKVGVGTQHELLHPSPQDLWGKPEPVPVMVHHTHGLVVVVALLDVQRAKVLGIGEGKTTKQQRRSGRVCYSSP